MKNKTILKHASFICPLCGCSYNDFILMNMRTNIKYKIKTHLSMDCPQCKCECNTAYSDDYIISDMVSILRSFALSNIIVDNVDEDNLCINIQPIIKKKSKIGIITADYINSNCSNLIAKEYKDNDLICVLYEKTNDKKGWYKALLDLINHLNKIKVV